MPKLVRPDQFWYPKLVRPVFHPNAPSYHHSSIPSVYRRHELQKKREYSVREVELASFTPLVFGTTGGMGKEALVFLSSFG